MDSNVVYPLSYKFVITPIANPFVFNFLKISTKYLISCSLFLPVIYISTLLSVHLKSISGNNGLLDAFTISTI